MNMQSDRITEEQAFVLLEQLHDDMQETVRLAEISRIRPLTEEERSVAAQMAERCKRAHQRMTGGPLATA